MKRSHLLPFQLYILRTIGNAFNMKPRNLLKDIPRKYAVTRNIPVFTDECSDFIKAQTINPLKEE
jgi:hypothetical protein